MSNILIISGHPDLQTSVANATILDEVTQAFNNADNVQIRKLDELYPNWQIDVSAEQNALLWADVIVWQFPFSWYSVPALLKKWLDEVFLYHFSHGSQAKLGGKKLLVSFTTGADETMYQKDGFMGYAIDELTPQFEISAKLCGMQWLEPIYTCGLSYASRDDEAKINAQKTLAKDHAKRLIDTLKPFV